MLNREPRWCFARLSRRTAAALALAAGLASVSHAEPLTSSFVYQAQLNAGGVPANGAHDLRFRLYDAASGGLQVGPALCLDNATVVAGAVSAVLDFGAVFDGRRFYLEVDVRADTGLDCSDASGYDTLSPRQAFSATPQASFSLTSATAASATTAGVATTATNAGLLNGQAASFYQDAANLTGTVPDARLAGTYSGAVTLSNATNVLRGNGAGLTALSATSLSTGTVADARLSANVVLENTANSFGNFTNTFLGSVGVGTTAPNGRLEVKGSLVLRDPGANSLLRLSPSTGGFGVNPEFIIQDTATGTGANTNFHVSRNAIWDGVSAYNRIDVGQKASSLQYLNNGDIGFYTAGAGANPITWTSSLYIDALTGAVGIANSTPAHPLNFATVLGDKISLYGNGANHFGFGVQADLLQIHGANASSDIVFGHGGSAGMTERVRFKGNGQVGIGLANPGDAALHVLGGARGNAVIAENATAGAVALTALSTGATGAGMGGAFESDSTSGTGLYAVANANTGTTYGVRGYTDSSGTNSIGVRGEALRAGTNFGVYGAAAGANSFGVYANGRLGASGTKSFMIDHPLDPENKVLLHYSAESPEVLNLYCGVVQLDGAGEAWVVLPDYFDAINIDPRYSLTSVGAPAPMLHVAEEVLDNRFKVAGGSPGGRVSWEVKAVRHDRFVQRYGAPAEQEKPAESRGAYIRPELYDLPARKGQFGAPAPARPTAPAAPAR